MISLALFLLMTAGAIGLLALPFLKREAAPERSQFDLSVYQDQLYELERDLERNVIDEEGARGAKLEIQRRILAVAGGDTGGQPVVARSGFSTQTMATAMIVMIVPLVAGLFYVQLGRPDMPDMPLATRIMPQQQQQGPDQQSLLAEIEQMEEHLESMPDNGELWVVLGRTRLRAGQFNEAVQALEKAAELMPANPAIRAEIGEAFVFSSEGQVTPIALGHFERVLEMDPNEPRSRYYQGLALAQRGEIDGAVDHWTTLLAVSPSDAPWRPQIESAISSALESTGRSAAEVVADLPEGTGPMPLVDGVITSQRAAIDALSPEQQNDEIKGMVASLASRLQDEPNDVDGWVMLGRSRLVLGEPDSAKTAFERAIALAPEDPDVLKAYASSYLQPGEEPDSDPTIGTRAVEIYERVAALAPSDPEPRWLLGLAAVQAGNKEEAARQWQDLLGLIDESSADYGVVQARLAALKNGGQPLAPAAAPGGQKSSEAMPVPASPETASAAPSGPQPTAEDVAEMAALSTGERNDRIRMMVDGLAARLEDDPSDVEGWLRLAQSRNVLGEPEAAKEAYEGAMKAAPNSTEVLRAYASSLLGDEHPETEAATVSDEAAALYKDLVKLEPTDPEAHWYLGLAAMQEGTIEAAKTHWQQVLDVLGPDHPNYATVQASLERVENGSQ